MITIGKRFTFEAAHFIEGHPTCGKLHGHSWVLTVMLKGNELNHNGMLIDFKVLGGIVRDITNHFDHKVINDTVSFTPITAETLVRFICINIRTHLVQVLGREESARIVELGCRLQEGIDGGWAEFWESNE